MESSRTFFENIAGDWAANHTGESTQRLTKIFNERIPPLHGPILDAGSGTGILIPFLREKSNGEDKIFQYDIAFNMLEEAKKKNSFPSHVYFVEGDGHELSFSDNCFDTLFCFQFIPHLVYKEKAFGEFYRVLKSGGRLFILHLMDHSALNMLHADADKAIHNHRMPPAVELAQMIEASGMQVENWEENKELYFIQAKKQIN